MTDRRFRCRRVVGRPALVAVLVAVGLAGCAHRGVDTSRVVVVGDSLTAEEQPQLSAALDPHYTLAYVFRYGITIAQAMPLLRKELASGDTPGALIVNLGTNDALEGRPDAAPRPTLAPVVAAATGIPCVVLTTVNTLSDQRGGSDVASGINAEIARLHRIDPDRYPVVDWNRMVQSLGPDRIGTYLQEDRIHETDTGARWLAEADASALASCRAKTAGTPGG